MRHTGPVVNRWLDGLTGWQRWTLVAVVVVGATVPLTVARGSSVRSGVVSGVTVLLIVALTSYIGGRRGREQR